MLISYFVCENRQGQWHVFAEDEIPAGCAKVFDPFLTVREAMLWKLEHCNV